ncbi:MAG: manganese efflux pump MntP family protein [Candidatus Omnitrophica bacterium]|nr:manganese efflux pump MntP family protein [Candidatus Omnitrophota bacterium]
MDIFILIGIAVGLSLDAFTVSVTNSTIIKNLELRHGLRMSVFFGFFQMIMPIIGWAAGLTFSQYIQGFDHWIAFGLLAFVGGRMIWSGLPMNKQTDSSNNENNQDCRNLPTLFVLSIATSIDAMAVGLSFALIEISIIFPAIIIGIITFLMSLIGYFIGKRIGEKLDFKLEVIGGIILIGIGIKILFDHIM